MTSGQMTIIALATLAALCASTGTVLLVRAASVRRRVSFLRAERFDPATAPLPREGIPMHLGPELVRSEWSGIPVTLVSLNVRGLNIRRSGRAVRSAMRADETCYETGRHTLLIALRGTPAQEIGAALVRFGKALYAEGAHAIYAGTACFPQHTTELGKLVRIAAARRVPLERAALELHNDGAKASFLHTGARASLRPPHTRLLAALFGMSASTAWLLIVTAISMLLVTLASQIAPSNGALDELRTLTLIVVLGAIIDAQLAGMVRSPHEVIAPWAGVVEREQAREIGWIAARWERIVSVALVLSVGALGMTGVLLTGSASEATAERFTTACVAAALGIVGATAGRALAAARPFIALLAAAAGITLLTLGDASTISLVTWAEQLSALLAAIGVGALAALVLRRPALAAACIGAAAIAAGAVLETVNLSADIDRWRGLLQVSSPGAAAVGVGAVATATALAALASGWRFPVIRTSAALAFGMAAAVWLRATEAFATVPTSAVMVAVFALIMGPELAGRMRGLRELRSANEAERNE